MALGIGDVFALSAVALGANIEAFFAKDKHRTGKGFSAGLNLLYGAVGCALGGNVDKNDGQTAVEREEIIEGLRDVADDANADQQANHGGDDLNQTCRLMRSRVLGARQIRNRFGANASIPNRVFCIFG